MRWARLMVLLAAGGVFLSASASAATHVAVFNFQMTSETPQWRWLQKGLSDRIATDFVQDPDLDVIARDRMQMLAAEMRWVPEMATSDPARMGRVKKALKIQYLVTGVYRVTGDGRIHLTGQVVEVASRREVARKEVEGKAANVLALQRRLSAELLAWFSKKPAEAILERLPVWTRSLPAAKALYEGMDLYDQGRYAEGWLKFRQASREDPGYVEAVYWTGKMYYFLHRYAHARRMLERFVYLDMAHPRLGDAMVEYVHTYEASGASGEDLLKLYETLGKRFPNARVWQGDYYWISSGKVRGDVWSRHKRMWVCTQMGRHQEVLDESGPVLRGPDWKPSGGNFRDDGCVFPFGIVNLMEHHARTGEIPKFRIVTSTQIMGGGQSSPLIAKDNEHWIRFEDSGRMKRVPIQPRRLTGAARAAANREMVFDNPWAKLTLGLRAPSGYVFEGLEFRAQVEGEGGYLKVRLSRPDNYGPLNYRCAPAKRTDLDEASPAIQFKTPPRQGILVAECQFGVDGPQSGPIVAKSLTIKPTLTRIQKPAVLEVACQNAADFQVFVDGALVRWYPGRAGPISPGSHTVRLAPVAPGMPYGEWSTEIHLRPDETQRLVARLPWADPDLWHKWESVLVGTGYPRPCPSLWKTGDERPALLPENDGVRLVWSWRGDLWSSDSIDGERFSAPRKVGLPVSSGWNEFAPRLIKDETGRFVLVFLSDRDPRHRDLAYICWSRDFVHWSNPSLVRDESFRELHGLMQDDRGRLILDCLAKERRLLVSDDGVRWTPEKMPGSVLTQDRTGRFCAYEIMEKKKVSEGTGDRRLYSLIRWTSGDLHTWSGSEVLGVFPSRAPAPGVFENGHEGRRSWLFALQGEKGPALLGVRDGNYDNGFFCTVGLYEPDARNRWRMTGRLWGFPPGRAVAVYHPRWGYLIASLCVASHEWWPRKASGPYVLRGPDLAPFREYRNQTPPPHLWRPPKKKARRSAWAVDGDLQMIRIGDPFYAREQKPPRVSAGEEGRLSYVPAYNTGRHVGRRRTFDVARLRPAPTGCGTVHPRAKVFTVDLGDQKIALALDAKATGAPHFDVLRLDPTGKGNFRRELTVPRAYLASVKKDARGPRRMAYQFAGDLPLVMLGSRPAASGVIVSYVEHAETAEPLSLNYELCTCAVGECRFGEEVYRVRFYDATNDLDVCDSPRPRWEGRSLADNCEGDFFWVDCYEDGDQIRWAKDTGRPMQYNGRLWRINEERTPKARVGQPILVDGRWWEVQISDDGRRVTAEPYTGPLAHVRLDHPFWRMVLVNEDSFLYVDGGEGAVPVPAGRYRVLEYYEYLVPNPNLWSPKLEIAPSGHRSAPGSGLRLNLEASESVTPVRLGSPLQGNLKMTQKEGALHFDDLTRQLRDVGGRPVRIDRFQKGAHKSRTVVRVRITLAPRSDERKITYDTTCYKASERGWKIPPGFTGTYTVTLEFPGNFPSKPNPVRFTVR